MTDQYEPHDAPDPMSQLSTIQYTKLPPEAYNKFLLNTVRDPETDCNRGLGLLGDTREALAAALTYIERTTI